MTQKADKHPRKPRPFKMRSTEELHRMRSDLNGDPAEQQQVVEELALRR